MDTTDVVTADAFKLSLETGEVVIEFGRLEGVQALLGQTSVSVTDRVVLPLETGRRLLVWLEESLRPHAGAMRAAQAKALAPADAATAARPGQVSQRPPPDQSGERAAQLLRLVGHWDVPHQYERSFRLSELGVQANRFLLTVNTCDVPGTARERALEVCDRLAMPATLRAAAEANFEMANCLHFGFEGDPGSIICKLYLERAVPGEEAQKARAVGEPVLLHLAFKWDLLGDAAVTTKYFWYPGLSAPEIQERLAHVYRGGQSASFDIARAMLQLAAEREPTENLQYLEVEEAENARRSFDLNVYNAKLRVKDIQPLLHRMREHFAIRPGQFQALYDQIKAMALGHLAGGVHRNGKDFFNVYYGVIGLPHFNRELR